MVDYWWQMCDERNLLLIENRSPAEDTHSCQTNALGQKLFLAMSLLDSAALIEAKSRSWPIQCDTELKAHVEEF